MTETTIQAPCNLYPPTSIDTALNVFVKVSPLPVSPPLSLLVELLRLGRIEGDREGKIAPRSGTGERLVGVLVLGAAVGGKLGSEVGGKLGSELGSELGSSVSLVSVGRRVVGCNVSAVGRAVVVVGAAVGAAVGNKDGLNVGLPGLGEGCGEDLDVGLAEVGFGVGRVEGTGSGDV